MQARQLIKLPALALVQRQVSDQALPVILIRDEPRLLHPGPGILFEELIRERHRLAAHAIFPTLLVEIFVVEELAPHMIMEIQTRDPGVVGRTRLSSVLTEVRSCSSSFRLVSRAAFKLSCACCAAALSAWRRLVRACSEAVCSSTSCLLASSLASRLSSEALRVAISALACCEAFRLLAFRGLAQCRPVRG